MVESLHTNVNVSGNTNPKWFMKLLRPQEKWLFDAIIVGKSSCFLFVYAFFGYKEKRRRLAD